MSFEIFTCSVNRLLAVILFYFMVAFLCHREARPPRDRAKEGGAAVLPWDGDMDSGAAANTGGAADARLAVIGSTDVIQSPPTGTRAP